MIKERRNIRLLEYDLLHDHPEVYAFSTTRMGGVSTGAYASMNCTDYTGDDVQCVCRNRDILLHSLPVCPQELIIPHQTHSTNLLVVDEDYLSAPVEQRQQRLEGIDALVTNLPNVCLCISTADCIPILLYDHCHRVVAAVHSGWRGTAGLIVLHTLEQMSFLYGTEASHLMACIGPGISREAYEVGEDVFLSIYNSLRSAGISPISLSTLTDHNPATGKYHVDLSRANRLLLHRFGLSDSQIEDCGICTYMRNEEFFSARRLGTRSGRILSGILLNPAKAS